MAEVTPGGGWTADSRARCASRCADSPAVPVVKDADVQSADFAHAIHLLPFDNSPNSKFDILKPSLSTVDMAIPSKTRLFEKHVVEKVVRLVKDGKEKREQLVLLCRTVAQLLRDMLDSSPTGKEKDDPRVQSVTKARTALSAIVVMAGEDLSDMMLGDSGMVKQLTGEKSGASVLGGIPCRRHPFTRPGPPIDS